MSKIYSLLLYILKYAIKNRPAPIRSELTEDEWSKLFFLASGHDVLPLVMNSVYTDEGLRAYGNMYGEMLRNSRKITVYQARRTADFLLLYKEMNKVGLFPLAVKGLICRNLYENPELRFSVDEDLLIESDEIEQYHSFLTAHGYFLSDPDTDIILSDEVSYRNPETNLYLEVHKNLFSPSDPAYGELNTLFASPEEPVRIPIYDTEVRTLSYTDHFLYLITHAYKHVIYSGIGIRQICDIALFAETYGKQIDWNRIIYGCKKVHLDVFYQAVMMICRKYFGTDTFSKAGFREDVDETPLLLDIMSGGTYGAADKNRLHSATMTLRAVTADNAGINTDGLQKTLFPSRSYMVRNYPYLRKHRYLLPIAWTQRIFSYLTGVKKVTDPGKTIKIGKKRIELLKKYKIIQ